MSIGQALAEARQRAGLTVTEVSRRTRIREAIIRDIENDNYAACGGDFYARGHIRSIARAAGVDPEPLIREYDSTHQVPQAMTLEDLFPTTPATGLTSAAPDAPTLPNMPAVPDLPATSVTSATPASRTRTHKRGRLNTAAAVALLVALVAAPGLVAYHVLSGTRHVPSAAPLARAHPVTRHRPSPAPTAATSAPAHRAVQPRVLIPASAAAFGPGGEGGGDNPDLAPLAIDYNRGTAWHTDWYTSAHFGNLYPGTGLLLDMGRRVVITAVRITLGGAPGTTLQLRVGAAPALADLPLAAGAVNTGDVVRLRLAPAARGRYVLIWFTSLPPDSAGTFRATVRDIRLEGRH